MPTLTDLQRIAGAVSIKPLACNQEGIQQQKHVASLKRSFALSLITIILTLLEHSIMENSEEYEKAVQVSRDAAIAYAAACVKYRKLEINDSEFAVAIAAHKHAEIEFDIAFDKEQARV